VLLLSTAHTDEHYGNMVTYLRTKGIVPPKPTKRGARFDYPIPLQIGGINIATFNVEITTVIHLT
jgi:hypothetical protein